MVTAVHDAAEGPPDSEATKKRKRTVAAPKAVDHTVGVGLQAAASADDDAAISLLLLYTTCPPSLPPLMVSLSSGDLISFKKSKAVTAGTRCW